LELHEGGNYRLPFAFDRLPRDLNDKHVIRRVEEELQVGKRVVDAGSGVRIHKTVTEREQLIDLPLMHDELQVQHVEVGKDLAKSDIPVTRYEGDTLIIPILEEVLVVETRLRLKEEVRITKRQREKHIPQTVVLKSEQISVERFEEWPDPSSRIV